MASRPAITVYDAAGQKTGQIQAPAVFAAPIRQDIVQTVHTHMAKNRRQAYAVKYEAGMQHSAISWGVGRALSRIPRVSGGGTSRSGQGAFGNMCRKGRMYSPTKVWRRWHRKIQVNQKRYATVSAIAASTVPALVMARGHNIGKLAEVPLVVDASCEAIKTTKAALKMFKAVGAGNDIARCATSRKARTGKAHQRSRTMSGRLGPLVVYKKDSGITRACRNIPGVETINVHKLNLLKLAPSGQLGRFVIWTKDAVETLNALYGTTTEQAKLKKGYKLPRSVMANADLERVINSSEVQSVLRARKTNRKAHTKVNLLTNLRAKAKLNPYALVVRRMEVAAQLRAAKARAAKSAAKKAAPYKKEYKLSEQATKKLAAVETIKANLKARKAATYKYAVKAAKKHRAAAKKAKATAKPAAKGGKK
jgi:large subunit ribosomal protein L4e